MFALTALTSLLMLQYVARQLANLAGKGLPWTAIAQFFVLSLPFTIAMTTPMAVLVATMYAFGRMAAEHEITAFKASGVRVRTLMLPVMFCAFLLSLLMVGFNDQILSRANHQLRILQQDISQLLSAIVLSDRAARDEHVDRIIGLDETGDTRNVVDADRGGALAIGQQRGDRRPLALARNLAGEDRLVDLDRQQRRAALAVRQ